jgi:MtN3 and saliva related transmembrane protein
MTLHLLMSAANFTGVSVEYVGYAAAFCTTSAFVPQLTRVIRLRSARDISLPTFLLFSIGVFLWLLYGLYTGSKPVIVSNSVTLVLSLSILILKLRYDRNAIQETRP